MFKTMDGELLDQNPASPNRDEPKVTAIPATTIDTVAGSGSTLLERLHRSFGPLIGGIIIDYVDFLSVGPIGPIIGLVLGYPVGWWISGMYGFTSFGRGVFALLTAIYCALPFTALIPLATIIACAARFFQDPPAHTSPMPPLLPSQKEE